MGDDAFKSSVSPLLTERFSYHALARSLESGTHTRPALPLELVREILRLAHCIIPSETYTIDCHRPLSVRARGHRVESQIWFKTPPLTREAISRIAAVRVCTSSKHQGWASVPEQGCWSWFQLAILPASVTNDISAEGRNVDDFDDRTRDRDDAFQPKKTKDGLSLGWKSHSNPVSRTDFAAVQGHVFRPAHELWAHIDVGDYVAVVGCAQYLGWKCEGQAATLEFWEFFEPTLPPRHIVGTTV